MNEDLKKMEHEREQLSALMDGQLQGEDWLQALRCAEQKEGRATWLAYHVVGDALRSTELAAHGASSSAFLARFQQRLAQEPLPAAQLKEATLQQVVAVPDKADRALPQSANASVFRWKMVAGLASLAVVASVGWNSFERLQLQGAPGQQLAAAGSARPVPAQVPAQQGGGVAASAEGSSPTMLRDPRLDELLAAHRQFGSTTALQMPAGFLRNATFEAPTR